MIKQLRIQNLGLLKDVDLSLSNELVAITGETGAGKTMVLTAIDALLGKKISNDLISEQESTLIEAEIDFSSPKLQEVAKRHELVLDENILIVSRSFSKDSRVRNFLGGRAVPASLIGEIMEELIFIHGQKDQARLSKPSYALNSLDKFCGKEHLDLLQEHQELFKTWQELKITLANLEAQTQAQMKDRARLEQLIADISEVNPIHNEDEIIEKKLLTLQNTEKIQKALSLAGQISDSDVVEQLGALKRSITSLESTEVEFVNLVNSIDTIVEEFSSFSKSASNLIESLEDKEDVDSLEARRFKLNRIIKLYGPSLAEVFTNLQNAQLAIAQLNDPGTYRTNLENEILVTETNLKKLAINLSVNRIDTARQLSNLITSELKDLMLSESEFIIQVSQHEPLGPTHTNSGFDNVEFLFRSNKKLSFGPIAKIASGGELSRLMLAIEVVLLKGKFDQILIFDEIDSGVGGKAAIEIAKRLQKLSKNSQVILVTHLPQVAAFASQQLVVEKIEEKNSVETCVTIVEDEARRLEISRMLAGLAGSESALQHADELLSLARNT